MPKFEEIAHEGRCDVCGKQTNVAVCASSCGPISLAYCRSCLEAGLEPYGIMLAYISGAGHWPISVKIIVTTGEKYGILAAWKS